MGWVKKLIKRKIMAMVVDYVIMFTKTVTPETIDDFDRLIDDYIKVIIKADWLEKLALDAEQVIIDDIIKHFLPEIKAWVIANAKLIIQNAQNPEVLIKRMADEIGDEIADEMPEADKPQPADLEEMPRAVKKRKGKK